MARTQGKIDGNQTEIVRRLRELGYSVWSTAALGRGFPDLIVGGEVKGERRNFLFELKDECQPLSKRKLTLAEEKFFDEWGGQVAVAENATDILLYFGRLI